MIHRFVLPAVALAAVAALPFAAGCRGGTSSLAPVTAPVATSPAGVVLLLEWGFDHRDLDVIAGLLTDDFQFISAGFDSGGNPGTPPLPWSRDLVFQALQGLFYGTPWHPPAESITLLFDKSPKAFPDTRPGKNPKWHKSIRTSVDLKVRIDSGNTVEVTGNALIFLTRGDSAAIPSDLTLQPDSSRWWIDRWEDETLAGSELRAAAHPARNVTLAAVLAYYLR